MFPVGSYSQNPLSDISRHFQKSRWNQNLKHFWAQAFPIRAIRCRHKFSTPDSVSCYFVPHVLKWKYPVQKTDPTVWTLLKDLLKMQSCGRTKYIKNVYASIVLSEANVFFDLKKKSHKPHLLSLLLISWSRIIYGFLKSKSTLIFFLQFLFIHLF